MLKFMGGPLTGLALNLTWVETIICSVIGMMLTVILILYSSDFFQRFLSRFRTTKKQVKRFTRLTRFGIKIRQKFGLMGIAFFTPILFTPPLGAVISVAFRYKKQNILLSMLLSAISWAFVQTFFFYYIKDMIFK